MSAAPGPAAAPADATPIGLGDAWRFFLPLIFMTELNMISKSVIHAFLARTPDPTVTLAAFNASFTFYYTVTSATEVATLLAISYLADRRCVARIAGFMGVVLAAPLALVAAVALTPLGDRLYGEVFGLSAAAVSEARLASILFAASAPVLVLRAVAFALLMVNRRTVFITLSTLVRLLSLGLSLALWPLVLDGAAIGAAALVTCMAFEAAFAWCFAWRHLRDLLARAGPLPGHLELWRFSWPLMLNQAAEMGVIFVINLFLGRLHDADLALAAFGVAHGLVSLLMSPMRNLTHTAQTLARSAGDVRVLGRFTLWLVLLFAGVAAALFWTPLRWTILDGVMGLEPRTSAYCAPAMQLAFAMAAFWGMAALFRGHLAGARSTRMLAVTGGMRLLTAALVGSLTLARPDLNGAVLGLAAWILAFGVESGVLGWRLRRRTGARSPRARCPDDS